MLNVVIVEDEDIIRQGLIHVIDWASMGCAVAGSAHNGEEGEKIINALRPDIVLTDIKMPKKSGIQMVEDCLARFRFKAIILTGYSDFEYAQKAVSLHVFEYLLKPVDEAALRRTIAKIQKELESDGDFIKRQSSAANSRLPFLIEDFDIRRAMDACPVRQVKAALKKILVSYAEPLSPAAIAQEEGVSAEYLSRKFKEYTGKTFIDVLNMRRIRRALELLQDGCYLMYEVALICGFSEYKYFCSVFKKYTGKSPGEAKREMAGD
ncbi:MAG: response regulator transcription factor [Treponema sp.]